MLGLSPANKTPGFALDNFRICFNEVLEFVDNDGDGFNNDVDCDDNNANVNPDAIEIPYDGIDNDCDPSTLDDDLDEDGFINDVDCDDNNANVNPDVIEIYGDGIDNDCDSNTLDVQDFNNCNVLFSENWEDYNSTNSNLWSAYNLQDDGLTQDFYSWESFETATDIFSNNDGSIMATLTDDYFQGNKTPPYTVENAVVNELTSDKSFSFPVDNQNVQVSFNFQIYVMSPLEVMDTFDRNTIKIQFLDASNSNVLSQLEYTVKNNVFEQELFISLMLTNEQINILSGELIKLKIISLCTANKSNGFAIDNLSLCYNSLFDNDNDGYNNDVDCDDNNAEINPGAEEIIGDGLDNDCNPNTLDDEILRLEKLADDLFEIYPNPFEDNLTIKMNQNGFYDVRLLDINGKIVYQTRLMNKDEVELNTTSLIKGVYIVEIKSEYISSRKVLIK